MLLSSMFRIVILIALVDNPSKNSSKINSIQLLQIFSKVLLTFFLFFSKVSRSKSWRVSIRKLSPKMNHTYCKYFFLSNSVSRCIFISLINKIIILNLILDKYNHQKHHISRSLDNDYNNYFEYLKYVKGNFCIYFYILYFYHYQYYLYVFEWGNFYVLFYYIHYVFVVLLLASQRLDKIAWYLCYNYLNFDLILPSI